MSIPGTYEPTDPAPIDPQPIDPEPADGQPIDPEPTDPDEPPTEGYFNVKYLVKYTTIAYGCYREIIISTEYGPDAAVGIAASRVSDFGAQISVEEWDGSAPPDRAPDGYPC